MKELDQIAYAKTVYGQEEIDAVVKCLSESTQMGNYSRKFEEKVAELFSKKHCLYVNSGSSALYIGIEAFEFPPGSEVITPALTFSTTVGSIVKNNLIPVFIDVEPSSFCIDVSQIEAQINEKTVAILAPNLMGNLCNWPKIRNIANKYNLIVIEDSADTIGAKINNHYSGSYSDMSITSFYGSHIISCAGNGGMFLTNNLKYYNRAKVIRSWGRMSTLIEDSENIIKRLSIKLKGYDFDKKFVFSEVGYNFEPSEIGASFGLEQLKKFKSFSKIRNRNFSLHFNFFKKYSNYFILPKVHKKIRTNFLAYPIILKKNILFDRKKLQIYLEQNKIQTRPIFSGNILRHPAFNFLIDKKNILSSYKESDYIMKFGLLIGCHHGLNYKNISYIHQVIHAFLKKL